MGTIQQVVLTITVTAGAALTQYRLVGTDNAPCQENAVALGVAEVDAAAGDATPVSVLGVIAVEAGAAIARGQRVRSDANARAVPCESNKTAVSAGIALDEAKAEGDVIRILRGV